MTLAYACVLIAAFIPYVCAGIAKWGPGFDNAQPRVYLEAVEGYRRRAHWAQLNAFEMFPVFAAAVLIAHQVEAPQRAIDAWAIGYVVARVLYVAAYLKDLATLRSLVWIAALGCVVALFIVAA